MPLTILRTSLVNAMFGGAFFLYFVFGTSYMKAVGFTGSMPEMIGVTALIAGWVARRAEDWGRKPLLLAGFAALPLRAVLFALAPGPWYLVGIQVLSGLTAAVIGIMVPLVIADVTRGTGRYNLAQGAVGTATGIGATLSTVVAGYVAQSFGYGIGFGGLAAVGAAGLSTLYWFLPETRARDDGPGSSGSGAVGRRSAARPSLV